LGDLLSNLVSRVAVIPNLFESVVRSNEVVNGLNLNYRTLLYDISAQSANARET